MAEIMKIVLELSILEAKAIHFALGKMTHTDYPIESMAEAGSNVYSELVVVEDDE